MAFLERGVSSSIQSFLMAEYNARINFLVERLRSATGSVAGSGGRNGLMPDREEITLDRESRIMNPILTDLCDGTTKDFAALADVLANFRASAACPGTIAWAVRAHTAVGREVLISRLEFWETAIRAAGASA